METTEEEEFEYTRYEVEQKFLVRTRQDLNIVCLGTPRSEHENRRREEGVFENFQITITMATNRHLYRIGDRFVSTASLPSRGGQS